MKKRLTIVILVTLILAISIFIENKEPVIDNENYILSNFSNIIKVKELDENCFALYNSQKAFSKPSSILSISSAEGYSGPIELGVQYDLDGNIIDVKVLKQTETPAFFKRVMKVNFLSKYKNKMVSDHFTLKSRRQKNDQSINSEVIEAVTAATISCNGINSAVQKANAQICKVYFYTKLYTSRDAIQIQIKDIVLLVLYLFAILVSLTKNKKLRKLFPAFQLLSLIYIGFVYKVLLSITHFNNLLAGNFPGNQYYWYLSLGLFIFSILILGKNLYFAYICPMGILQDYFGKLPVKKLKFRNKKYYQYPATVLTLGILVYALIAKQPGTLGYEIFGAIFRIDFASFLFIIGIISLVLSLFIRRFWCKYLCPVGVIGRFLMMVRKLFIRS